MININNKSKITLGGEIAADISLKILQSQVNSDIQNTSSLKSMSIIPKNTTDISLNALPMFHSSNTNSVKPHQHIDTCLVELSNMTQGFLEHVVSSNQALVDFKLESVNIEQLKGIDSQANLVKFKHIIQSMQYSKQSIEKILLKLSDDSFKEELYHAGVDVYDATENLESTKISDFLAKFWANSLMKSPQNNILTQISNKISEYDFDNETLNSDSTDDVSFGELNLPHLANMYHIQNEELINPVNITSKLMTMFFMGLQYTQQMVASIEALVTQVNEAQASTLQDMGSMLSQFSQMYKTSIDLINSYLSSQSGKSTISSLDFTSPLKAINGVDIADLVKLFNDGITKDDVKYGPSPYISIEGSDPSLFKFKFGLIDSNDDKQYNPSAYVMPREFAYWINPNLPEDANSIQISIKDFIRKVLPVVTLKIYSTTIMKDITSGTSGDDEAKIRNSSYYTNMSTLIGGSYSIDTAISNNAQISKSATDRVNALQQYVSADNSSILQMISTISNIIQQLGQASIKLLS